MKSVLKKIDHLRSVLGIRIIWARIRMRIWILGSVPLTNGSGCGFAPGGPKAFGSGLKTLVHLHHSSKIQNQKEVIKHQKSRFFFLFLLDNGRIWIRRIPTYD
jgi:hypothetical protein